MGPSSVPEDDFPLKIQNWLSGTPLARMLQFRRGRAGRTPTIVPRGLVEVQPEADGQVMLLVTYQEHGRYAYTRSPDKMPEERDHDNHAGWKPVIWLEKRTTFGSPSLNVALPNRVAEWLEGRRLSPR